MAYTVLQRYSSAILSAYAGNPDVDRHLAKARSHRMWLEGLELEAGVKASLVEQARVIEEAFEHLARRAT